MRILLLTDGITPYVVGGMQRHSYYLCRHLLLLGSEVCLVHFTLDNKPYATEQEVFNHLEIDEEYRAKFTHLLLPFPTTIQFPGHYVYNSIRYSKSIWEALKDTISKYDIIYSKGFCAWYFIKNKKQVKAPIISNIHGYEMYQKSFGLKSFLINAFLKIPANYIIKHSDHMISYGGKITELLLNIGVVKERIIESPGGYNPSFSQNREVVNQLETTFLFVGRYERRKAIEEIVEAIQMFENKSCKFLFAGPIPEHLKLHGPQFTYYGVVNDTNALKEVYAKADVLLCPSYSEGMPNVIMEAMGSGLAIIATDVGASSLLVNSDNGILLKNNSALEIVKALQFFIALPKDTLLQMKQQSVVKIKAFNWEEIGFDLLKKMKKIVENKK